MPARKRTKAGRRGGTEALPDVRAILAGDLHLQARAPVARCGEPDWFTAMTRPLRELATLQEANGGVPIFYAGDIFDRWNAGPEIINFALEHLPYGYAVPGQHDLPNHNYHEIKRSAYWTLVKAGAITNLPPGEPFVNPAWFDNIIPYGYPWGYPPRPVEPIKSKLQVAVVHGFIWQKGTGYPGAPDDRKLGAYNKALAGYTAAAFGDNHKGFIAETKSGVAVCNCGGFMRRKIDERDYRPGVGLLHADGTVTRHYFDTEDEHFATLTAAEEAVAQVLDMGAFTEALHNLEANDALDFISALKRFIRDNKTPGRVSEIILQASEGE